MSAGTCPVCDRGYSDRIPLGGLEELRDDWAYCTTEEVRTDVADSWADRTQRVAYIHE